jgi:hypothetical protein
MQTLGIWKYTITENGARQAADGSANPLYDLTLFNTVTNTAIKMDQLTRIFEREDFFQMLWDESQHSINGGYNCCLENRVHVVNVADLGE